MSLILIVGTIKKCKLSNKDHSSTIIRRLITVGTWSKLSQSPSNIIGFDHAPNRNWFSLWFFIPSIKYEENTCRKLCINIAF